VSVVGDRFDRPQFDRHGDGRGAERVVF